MHWHASWPNCFSMSSFAIVFRAFMDIITSYVCNIKSSVQNYLPVMPWLMMIGWRLSKFSKSNIMRNLNIKQCADAYSCNKLVRAPVLAIIHSDARGLSSRTDPQIACIMTMPPILGPLVLIDFHKKYFYKKAEFKIVQYFPKSEFTAGASAITSIAVHYFPIIRK